MELAPMSLTKTESCFCPCRHDQRLAARAQPQTLHLAVLVSEYLLMGYDRPVDSWWRTGLAHVRITVLAVPTLPLQK